jgi:dienelactone hydrolase
VIATRVRRLVTYLQVAAALDLLSWGGKITCLRSIAREFLVGKGRGFDDVEAVRTWLTQQEGCTGKIGVIGFCFGARTSNKNAFLVTIPNKEWYARVAVCCCNSDEYCKSYKG